MKLINKAFMHEQAGWDDQMIISIQMLISVPRGPIIEPAPEHLVDSLAHGLFASDFSVELGPRR